MCGSGVVHRAFPHGFTGMRVVEVCSSIRGTELIPSWEHWRGTTWHGRLVQLHWALPRRGTALGIIKVSAAVWCFVLGPAVINGAGILVWFLPIIVASFASAFAVIVILLVVIFITTFIVFSCRERNLGAFAKI